VAIDGVLGDASGTPVSGAAPQLESSRDGVTFTAAGVGVGELPGGTYRAVVAPESRTFYRFAFADAGGLTGSHSSAVLVTPRVSLATPYAKSVASHTKSFTASGKIRPAHNSSSRTVKLQIKRWTGHVWRDYGSKWTRVTYKGSYSAYSASLKLSKGTYRIYAYAPADALHATTTSGYVKVIVK
jgi:hypothetical protein